MVLVHVECNDQRHGGRRFDGCTVDVSHRAIFSRIVVIVVEAVGFGFSCDDVRVLTRRHLPLRRDILFK